VHAKAGASVPPGIYHHALAVGFSKGFLVSAGIMVLGLIATIVLIRVTREDLAGAQNPMMADSGAATVAEAGAELLGAEAQPAEARRAVARPSESDAGELAT
jgi:hypothetical protein